jgi:DNA-binding transcriptional ArsR family regulator
MTAVVRETESERLSQLCKALGHPVRVEILRYVRQHPRCIGNEILLQLPDPCARAQSTLSQHLKVLCEANLIESEHDGPAVTYTVNEEQLAWLRERLAEFLGQSHPRVTL